MDSIFERNEQLLKEWEKASEDNNEQSEFVPDGILYRGDAVYSSTGCWGHERGTEDELWQHSPMRILYITKDLNDEESWDIRCETCRENYSGEDNVRIASNNFCKNYLYQIYGLGHTTPEKMTDYNGFSDKDAIEYFDKSTIARINVKKQLGKSSISNYVLKKYIDKYSDFIKRQILLLDADIIVCCGSSNNSLDKLILNFVKENCYNLEKINNWIYYCAEMNKVVVDSWHLSVRGVSIEDFYNDMISAYHSFLKEYPKFLIPHR